MEISQKLFSVIRAQGNRLHYKLGMTRARWKWLRPSVYINYMDAEYCAPIPRASPRRSGWARISA